VLAQPCESGNGGGEGEEAAVVVRPALASLVDVGIRSFDAGHRHQRQRAGGGVAAGARVGGCRPCWYLQLDPCLALERDASVVGQHDLHFHALTPQLGREPRRGGGKPAHRHDRMQLRGRVEDAHAL
jgi:hypothetical protein